MEGWTLMHIDDIDVNSTQGLVLGRVLSISFTEEGLVMFREQCDEWFDETMTKEEAVKLLEDAIKWIKEKITCP